MNPNQSKTDGAPLVNNHTDVGDALAFARSTFEPRVVELQLDGLKGKVLVVPGANGTDVHDVKYLLEDYRETPERRKGTITVDDLQSFIDLVNRDKNNETVIFARRDKTRPRLVAVLDYHPGASEPGWCEDRIRWDMGLSDEWKAWFGQNGSDKAMSQEAFARWLEDHIFDIGEPDAAGPTATAFAAKMQIKLAGPQTMLATSRGLEVRVNSSFKGATNIRTGETTFQWEEQHSGPAGAALDIPHAFHIMIPIFQGGQLYSIPTRLRYRVSGPKVSWYFEMHRPDLFVNDAIDDVLKRVRMEEASKDGDESHLTGCSLPVIVGTPPATKGSTE